MNTLVSLPKNGGLSKSSSNVLPAWSSLFDEFFDREFSPVFDSRLKSESMPKVNIKETAEEYIVEMAAPGLNKSDFNINLDNRVLTIGTEISDQSDNSDRYTRREFTFESFKRTFKLPESVNDDQINASYENGILQVLLPKREEAKQKPARTIDIS